MKQDSGPTYTIPPGPPSLCCKKVVPSATPAKLDPLLPIVPALDLVPICSSSSTDHLVIPPEDADRYMDALPGGDRIVGDWGGVSVIDTETFRDPAPSDDLFPLGLSGTNAGAIGPILFHP